MSDKYVIDDELKCGVERIEYDFGTNVGIVVMEPHHCTDMEGVIDFFKRIDPNVRHIITQTRIKWPDTLYQRTDEGWVAVLDGERGPCEPL